MCVKCETGNRPAGLMKFGAAAAIALAAGALSPAARAAEGAPTSLSPPRSARSAQGGQRTLREPT